LQQEYDAAVAERLSGEDVLSMDGLDQSTLPEPPPRGWYEDWNQRVNDYLFDTFHVAGHRMPATAGDKLDAARAFAKRLAVEVELGDNAPDELVAAVEHLDDLGYKLVSGRDIGHMHVRSGPLMELDGALTTRRRIAEWAGLNPDMAANADVGAARTVGIRHAIQDLIDTGVLPQIPYWDADTYIAFMRRRGVIDDSPGPIRGALYSLFQRVHTKAGRDFDVEGKLAELRSETFGLTEPQLRRLARQDAAAEITKALQLRDIPRKRFVDAFTDPEKFERFAPESHARQADELGIPWTDVGVLNEKQANALYRAVVKGSAAPGTYQLGASRLEDLFRASMGFAGKGVIRRTAGGAVVGGTVGALSNPNALLEGDLTDVEKGAALGAAGALITKGDVFANLPNRLVQIRNEARFELSPYFSLRRVAKTNVKMILEDVPPTVNPIATMRNAGTLAHDREVLAEVLPEYSSRVRAADSISDDADRYLQQQDIFGFYSHRNYEAYAAGHWKRMGFSNDEIRDKLTRVFGYGSNGVEGRSALERSTNFIFFPFSFDKTLYRNLGAYLLDRPAQRLVLTAALHAYDEFNTEHGDSIVSTHWWAEHAPILEEASRLNAFYHGVSPGEPGGINRPLLNIFLPQAWSSSKDNLAMLKRFIPAVNDFSRIWEEAQQQQQIIVSEAHNLTRSDAPTIYNPEQSAQTSDAQLEQAFNMARVWTKAYAKAISHNAKIRDPQKPKITFGDVTGVARSEWGPYADQPITKANISRLIARRFPAYSASKGAEIAVGKAADWQTYVTEDLSRDPELQGYVRQFGKSAESFSQHIDDPGYYTPGKQREITTALRAQALWIAQREPTFYRLYDRTFGRALGPLEELGQ
jgi:hypothetical protein